MRTKLFSIVILLLTQVGCGYVDLTGYWNIEFIEAKGDDGKLSSEDMGFIDFRDDGYGTAFFRYGVDVETLEYVALDEPYMYEIAWVEHETSQNWEIGGFQGIFERQSVGGGRQVWDAKGAAVPLHNLNNDYDPRVFDVSVELVR